MTMSEVNISEMTIEKAVEYINNYPLDGSIWVQHRTRPELEIEEQFPHRIRYTKHHRHDRTSYHIRRVCKGPQGYLSLGHREGSPACARHHRLVIEHFIINSENKNTVDHINRCRHDNHISNLRWATVIEQYQNSTPFHKFKGVDHEWLNVLPSDYIELTVMNGRELLPHTFYQIGNEYVQKYVDVAQNEIRYRKLKILNRGCKADGSIIHYRYFRDVHNRQFQVTCELILDYYFYIFII
jgi:hypothetical protein